MKSLKIARLSGLILLNAIAWQGHSQGFTQPNDLDEAYGIVFHWAQQAAACDSAYQKQAIELQAANTLIKTQDALDSLKTRDLDNSRKEVVELKILNKDGEGLLKIEHKKTTRARIGWGITILVVIGETYLWIKSTD